MRGENPADLMWAEAVQALREAERLHRQLFQPSAASREPAWEPPIDVLETGGEVLILAALPGVDPDAVETTIEDGALLIRGRRVLPQQFDTAVIHRLELPQGRFERRVPLPPGRYDAVRRAALNGCVVVSLHKAQ